MVDNRIVLRLNDRIEFEREFGARYRAVPRARRQEWIRTVLRIGLAGFDGAGQLPAAVLHAAAPASAPVAVPARVAAPAPAPAAAATVDAAPAASAPVAAPVKTAKAAKADSLAGFFSN